MTTYLKVWLRGFVLVALVSMNTRQIAAGNYAGAFAVGWLISMVWWANSSKHREDVPWAGATYAFGAAIGTVTGMWLGG